MAAGKRQPPFTELLTVVVFDGRQAGRRGAVHAMETLWFMLLASIFPLTICCCICTGIILAQKGQVVDHQTARAAEQAAALDAAMQAPEMMAALDAAANMAAAQLRGIAAASGNMPVAAAVKVPPTAVARAAGGAPAFCSGCGAPNVGAGVFCSACGAAQLSAQLGGGVIPLVTATPIQGP